MLFAGNVTKIETQHMMALPKHGTYWSTREVKEQEHRRRRIAGVINLLENVPENLRRPILDLMPKDLGDLGILIEDIAGPLNLLAAPAHFERQVQVERPDTEAMRLKSPTTLEIMETRGTSTQWSTSSS